MYHSFHKKLSMITFIGYICLLFTGCSTKSSSNITHRIPPNSNKDSRLGEQRQKINQKEKKNHQYKLTECNINSKCNTSREYNKNNLYVPPATDKKEDKKEEKKEKKKERNKEPNSNKNHKGNKHKSSKIESKQQEKKEQTKVLPESRRPKNKVKCGVCRSCRTLPNLLVKPVCYIICNITCKLL